MGFYNPKQSMDDYIGIFSPANFSDSICPSEDQWVDGPLLCTTPIKFQYTNYATTDYAKTGKGSLRLQIINQRSDVSFTLFSGGLSNPELIAHSNSITFANPKAPVYPRLAQEKSWDEDLDLMLNDLMLDDSGQVDIVSRRLHRLSNGAYKGKFKSFLLQAPSRSVATLCVAQIDVSNEYNDFERGSVSTTHQLVKDLKNIDMVMHIGDICYVNGYLSQWDQFIELLDFFSFFRWR
ncbi:probable inactive purple acid phosphatase 1 [Triticum dicoccoides]|uniref:probable inactive purple acid phosphatase 1 n=1 Tax=Triticum dicoccoides TaxID=85692 RepID=UPI00188F77FD|nr:probable inactive purple acid phosphatase 1 [Triticum dicoccoides]